MIARDKKLTRLCSPAFGDLRRSKELLGPTVTTDHGIMQRLLPVTWTDIPTFGHMVAPPLDYALYCKDNRRRL